ncbi:hypothetical protein LEP1GSC035_1954 [Leptospira noguchii str. 2007001578]|uniref:Transcriptional regulator, YlxM/p13 domain protein n=1 Tax=Leptospira noguchii str. 2007001578 TaxID=1049974 RepID=A0ABP2TD30_9LEPT|nr:hypothetical protein LEP1GSC035_1954 [Leptospira noguchii str. 2007001578]
METHRFEYSIQSMANVLGVSRSGFYQFLKRSKNELEKYNPELVEFIRETWLTSRKELRLSSVASGSEESVFNLRSKNGSKSDETL